MLHWLLTLHLLVHGAEAQTPSSVVDDPIVLAAKLISDGHADRANSVLITVDIENLGTQESLYYSTLGSIQEKNKQWTEAKESFQLAITILNGEAGEKQEGIDLVYVETHLARCWVELTEFQSAIDVLEAVSADSREVIWYLLMNRAQQGLEVWEVAWSTLLEGVELFANNLELRHQVISLAVQLHLHDAIEPHMFAVLNHADVQVVDFIRIADVGQKHAAYDIAEMALRLGRLNGYNAELWTASAVIALKMEEWLLAAELLSVLSLEDSKYAIETAEAYRSAGRYRQALQHNGFAPSSKEKAQQRFSLLLEMEQYAQAVALTDRLTYWKLTEDDAIRYGLAYAHFQLKSFDEALQYCSGITDRNVFQQSVTLRQIIRDCQESNACW